MQFVAPDPSAIIEIIGVDSSSWTVSGENAGYEGVVLNEGSTGLQEAPRTTNWQTGAHQEGSTYVGSTIEPHDMVLGFQIWGDEENWHDVTSRFRKAWDYDNETTIRISTESGSRDIQVRLFEAPMRDTNKDPRLVQYSLETYTVRAAWPFWEGDGTAETKKIETKEHPAGGIVDQFEDFIKRLLQLEVDAPYYGTTEIEVYNPTDRPMYLQWVCSAPGRWTLPDWSFQDDDQANRSIICPTLDTDEILSIDTYPRNEPYVTTSKTNAAGRFGGVMFLNSVPPGTPPTKLPVAYAGTDREPEVTCVQRHYWNGPWGGE